MCDPLEHEWDKRSVEFPLTSKSVVFEVGGYIGRWAREIAERFQPELHVFEPQPWAYDMCKVALSPYQTAHVYPFGLATKAGKFDMGNFGTDGCSLVNAPSERPFGRGRFVEIMDFLRSERIGKIDLMLMNIEGYEFELIPYMLEQGLIQKKINYFMCQFHLLVPERDEPRYQDIRRKMDEIKHLRFDYGTPLVCWEKV